MGVFDAIGDVVGSAVDVVGGAVGELAGGIINVVFPQVSEAINQFNNQKNAIEEHVRAPIQAMMEEVNGGEIWRGPGAEKFLSEMSNVFLPEAQVSTDTIESIAKTTQNGLDIMQAADKKAVTLANELAEQFRNITKTL